MKKQTFTLLSLTAIGIGIATLISGTMVSAQEDAVSGQTLVQRIAERFGLNESDVQDVFDEHHEKHHEQMEIRMQDRLDELVDQGSLTSQQRDMLLEKHEELEANRDNWQDIDPQQRREMMQNHHKEMQDWADENGIDLSAIMPFDKEFHHHDMMRFNTGS